MLTRQNGNWYFLYNSSHFIAKLSLHSFSIMMNIIVMSHANNCRACVQNQQATLQLVIFAFNWFIIRFFVVYISCHVMNYLWNWTSKKCFHSSSAPGYTQHQNYTVVETFFPTDCSYITLIGSLKPIVRKPTISVWFPCSQFIFCMSHAKVLSSLYFSSYKRLTTLRTGYAQCYLCLCTLQNRMNNK